MDSHSTSQDDLFLRLLRRFQEEGVEYVLVGGQAVRLSGFVRATEDVDVLLKPCRRNGEKIIRALEIACVAVQLLNIDGLLKTKTNYREKDILDKSVLMRLRDSLI